MAEFSIREHVGDAAVDVHTVEAETPAEALQAYVDACADGGAVADDKAHRGERVFSAALKEN